MRPEDCARFEQIQFFPNGNPPVGTKGDFIITAKAFSESHPDGMELSGVVFPVEVPPETMTA